MDIMDIMDIMDVVDGEGTLVSSLFEIEPHAPCGAPRGMKMGENRGWTLMDTDIPDSCQRFLSIRVYLRLSAVRIFETEKQHFQWLQCRFYTDFGWEWLNPEAANREECPAGEKA